MDSITNIVNEGAVSISKNTQTQTRMGPDLFKAAAGGNIQPFKELKDKNRWLEQIVTQFKDTILHVNIKSQDETKVSTKFVEQILDMCPSLLLQVNAKGDTPLHVAAKCGHSDVVELLIQRAKAQDEEVVLESGLRPEWEMMKMTNNENNTALHEAIRNDKRNAVKILTRYADPDFSYYANNSGETPIYIAARRGYNEMAVITLESCKSAAFQGPNGKTALHTAAVNCSQDVVEKILEKKKSLTQETDEHGWTPLHFAAYYGRSSNAEVLLKYDKSAAYIGDNDRKMTALHMAASRGHLRIIKLIILHCTECYDMLDNRGWNVLHFAMLSLPEHQVEVLLQNPLIRSLINEKDAKGNTPLHTLAAIRENYLIFYYHKYYSGDYAAVNKQNVTVGHVACYGSPELKQEIEELSKNVGKGQQYPDGVIRIWQVKSGPLKDDADVDRLKETRESHLIVATLIATVTFAAAFTSPGGYKSDQGTAILRRNSAFQAFIITDTIAMTLSLSAVFLHLLMSFKILQNFQFLYKNLFSISVLLTIAAMGAMVFAFITGIYAVSSPSLGLAITACLIGLMFFPLVFWVLSCPAIYIFRRLRIIRKLRPPLYSLVHLVELL